ncbi:cadherin-related family member 2 [Hippocampus zosterae]|uniref:cadherin-related family member 2 n=1 Tax=Hippocampus zosterae TaxID=109293 RepID=UPI00223E2D02|nr:cadherin-related family member 2 [Hippocampus zosterae]XP_051929188.1 cadherin-related family member 2 [Hippocampus zosterae]XP_051929197.1 cadherin-related family member 2 [Hippocampus zosterae]
MEWIPAAFLLLCVVNLIHAQNKPTIHTVVANVCEDTPLGAHAFRIDATDKDNDPLMYSLYGENATYFSVDNMTGDVTVARKLDREVYNLLTLGISVSDGNGFARKNMTVILNEANDNRPIFQGSKFDIEVKESTRTGTSLFRVQATDEDILQAGQIKYSIADVFPSNGLSLFSIAPETGDVTLTGALNYTGLSSYYRMKINATDGGGQCFYSEINYHSNIVFYFITVLDVADLDPKFLGLPYIGSVDENSAVDHSIYTVTAIDQDTEINDRIIYSIEDSKGLFKISSNDGVISVASEIDREEIGDHVKMIIKATESQPNIHGEYASTTASIQININDINDNKPEFYKCEGSGELQTCEQESQFEVDVAEHSLGGVPIKMMVKDKDKIKSIRLTLKGADKDVLSVEPQFSMADTVVQLVVKEPQKLDYEETQRMVVEVIASDPEEITFVSTATVTIMIQDINDNNPKFPKDSYLNLNVTEHSEVDTVVATITADDPDTMDKDNITYMLLPESIRTYFDVEPKTGVIYVKNKTLLDRETRPLHSATLQAKDSDGKPATALLQFIVTDINDQPPAINKEYYQEFVKEGSQLELQVEATDADEPGTLNSQIVFAILPSKYSEYFSMDPNTGVLRNQVELDREELDAELKGKIELNVTATDMGTPALSTVVNVIINVEDVNDNPPEFKNSSYKFSVKEGEKGAYVGKVLAQDLDQTTDFNRIALRIISGSFDSFAIVTSLEEQVYLGNITVDLGVDLDYEGARQKYTLQVEATDLGLKKAVATVEVDVLDVNDERPEFLPSKPVKVKENTTLTEAIGKFEARDQDGNHSLTYEMESLKCRCNGSLSPCDWFVLEPTGDVLVNPGRTLDYEMCDRAVMEAQVIDEYTEKGENYSLVAGQMEINIEDINDNAPHFIISDSIFAVVSETASKGTSVGGVTAMDRDTEIHALLEFQVSEVKFEDANKNTSITRSLFEAVTTQQKDIYIGIIQTTEGLDVTLKGKYLVTVSATDSGGLSTHTTLEIFTVDKSYRVELQFRNTRDEVVKNQPAIIRTLTAATKAVVEVVAIRDGATEESRASVGAVMVAYFLFSNGTALTKSEVELMISGPQHAHLLDQLGLMYITDSSTKPPETDPLQFISLGIMAGLIIVLIVLITSLVCTRRNYRRKLKAAKAMNSATMVASDNLKSGPVVPGTNKYTMEGANPVLNLNIDTAMVLDLDGESSDVDKVSLDSLDYSDDMNTSGKDTKPVMRKIQEEVEPEDNGPPEYIEPLGTALAQRSQEKGSESHTVGVSNPAFSTTDL